MNTLDEPQLVQNQPTISPKALKSLQSTSPWMVFLGVMFGLGAVLMLMTGVNALMSAHEYSSQALDNAIRAMGVFFIIAGILFSIGTYLIIICGTRLNTFSKYPTSEVFEEYTAKQQKFWMVMGIYAITSILFIIVFIALAGRAASIVAKGMAG